MKGDAQRVKVLRYRELLNLRLELVRLATPLRDPEPLREIVHKLITHMLEEGE
jgi:predicted component of type VI protein secretion system